LRSDVGQTDNRHGDRFIRFLHLVCEPNNRLIVESAIMILSIIAVKKLLTCALT